MAYYWIEAGVLITVASAWILFVNSLNFLPSQKLILYLITMLFLAGFFYNIAMSGKED